MSIFHVKNSGKTYFNDIDQFVSIATGQHVICSSKARSFVLIAPVLFFIQPHRQIPSTSSHFFSIFLTRFYSINMAPSIAWKYFKRVPDTDYAECQLKKRDKRIGIELSVICSDRVSTKSGTSAMLKHLSGVHKMDLSELTKASVGSTVSASNQSKINFLKRNKPNRGRIFARAAAIDMISLNAMKNSLVVKDSLTLHGHKMPKSEITIKREIIQFYHEKVEELRQLFEKLKQSGKKFSICTDEWTNMLSLRRFINVTVHTETDYFKLGLKVCNFFLIACFYSHIS